MGGRGPVCGLAADEGKAVACTAFDARVAALDLAAGRILGHLPPPAAAAAAAADWGLGLGFGGGGGWLPREECGACVCALWRPAAALRRQRAERGGSGGGGEVVVVGTEGGWIGAVEVPHDPDSESES